MSIRPRSLVRTAAAASLAAVISVGAVSVGSAAAEGPTTPTRNRPTLTDEQKCENRERIENKVETIIARIEARLERLRAARARAEANGNAERVAKIDELIARLEARLTTLQERLAAFIAWATENCPA